MVGALGVIGPERMNYSKIIPIVTYTSKMVTKFLSNGSSIPHFSLVFGLEIHRSCSFLLFKNPRVSFARKSLKR